MVTHHSPSSYSREEEEEEEEEVDKAEAMGVVTDALGLRYVAIHPGYAAPDEASYHCILAARLLGCTACLLSIVLLVAVSILPYSSYRLSGSTERVYCSPWQQWRGGPLHRQQARPFLHYLTVLAALLSAVEMLTGILSTVYVLLWVRDETARRAEQVLNEKLLARYGRVRDEFARLLRAGDHSTAAAADGDAGADGEGSYCDDGGGVTAGWLRGLDTFPYANARTLSDGRVGEVPYEVAEEMRRHKESVTAAVLGCGLVLQLVVAVCAAVAAYGIPAAFPLEADVLDARVGPGAPLLAALIPLTALCGSLVAIPRCTAVRWRGDRKCPAPCVLMIIGPPVRSRPPHRRSASATRNPLRRRSPTALSVAEEQRSTASARPPTGWRIAHAGGTR